METNREYWTKRLKEASNLEAFENVMLEYHAWLQKKCYDQRRLKSVKMILKDCVSCQYFFQKLLYKMAQ